MIPFVVLGVALAVGAVLVGWERRGEAAPMDTAAEERWLIAHAPDRWRPALRVVDRRVAGGIVVAAGYVVVLLTVAVVGWLLQSIDSGTGFARWDRSAAQFGADHASARSTDVLRWVTQLGATPVLLGVALVVAVVAWRRQGLGPVAYLAVVFAGIVLLNNGLKLLVDRPRPDVDQLVVAIGTSFPSGHSANAAALWAAFAVVLLRWSTRRRRAIGLGVAAAIAVAVAASRVLLGVHWLTDVLAGLTEGWAWFALVTIAFGGRLLRFGAPLRRV